MSDSRPADDTRQALRTTFSAKVLRAMGLFSGVQGVGVLCSVVRAKLIALWIGPAGVGLFAIFNSAIDMVGAATQLNIRESAVRDVSNTPASGLGRMAGVVRWWSRRLGLLGALAMLLLSPVLSVVSFGDMSHWWAFCVLSLALAANAVTSGEQALLQGTRSLKRLARSAVTGAVAGTVLSIPLYFFFGQRSIVPSILVFSLCTLASVMSNTDVKSRSAGRQYNIEQGKGFLRLGAYLTVSAVVTTVASYAFIAYLNHVGSETTVGYYQAGYTLVIRYTGLILTALSMEFFPRVSCVSSRPGMTSTVVSHEIQLILYVLVPCVVLFASLAQVALYLLYTAEFYAVLPFVCIGIGAMVFRALSFCMAYTVIGRGDGRVYIATEVVSALTGLALNVSMYHFFGFVGLGCSYVLWYVIYAVMMWTVYTRRYRMRLSRPTIKALAYAVAIVAAAIGLRTLGWWQSLLVLPAAMWYAIVGLRALLRKK